VFIRIVPPPCWLTTTKSIVHDPWAWTRRGVLCCRIADNLPVATRLEFYPNREAGTEEEQRKDMVKDIQYEHGYRLGFMDNNKVRARHCLPCIYRSTAALHSYYPRHVYTTGAAIEFQTLICTWTDKHVQTIFILHKTFASQYSLQNKRLPIRTEPRLNHFTAVIIEPHENCGICLLLLYST